MKETDFTRKRKLGFAEIFVVVVKGAKRGFRATAKEVAQSVRFEVKDYTEMAFCKVNLPTNRGGQGADAKKLRAHSMRKIIVGK